MATLMAVPTRGPGILPATVIRALAIMGDHFWPSRVGRRRVVHHLRDGDFLAARRPPVVRLPAAHSLVRAARLRAAHFLAGRLAAHPRAVDLLADRRVVRLVVRLRAADLLAARPVVRPGPGARRSGQRSAGLACRRPAAQETTVTDGGSCADRRHRGRWLSLNKPLASACLGCGKMHR